MNILSPTFIRYNMLKVGVTTINNCLFKKERGNKGYGY